MMYSILDLCKRNKFATDKLIELAKDTIDYTKKYRKKMTVDFDDLTSSEQEELIALLIDSLDDPYEWIVESDLREQTMCMFTRAMYWNSASSKDKFYESIKQQAVSYFAKRMQELFEMIQGGSI